MAQPTTAAADNSGSFVMRVVGWAVLCLGLAITGCFEAVFGLMSAMGFDGCDSVEHPVACGVTAQWAATLIPVIGAIVGFVAAVAMPWVFTPRPRSRWVVLGAVIQLVTFGTMLVILSGAHPAKP